MVPAGVQALPAWLRSLAAKQWRPPPGRPSSMVQGMEMAHFVLSVNGRDQVVDAEPAMPLLWVLRDLLNMTGTKYGCGMGLCGACTVHIDGAATRSCQTS